MILKSPGAREGAMKILLHICCANCAIYPVERLTEQGVDVAGYFFNPNIHPYQEYQRRLETLRQYSASVGLNLICRDEYLLEEFLRNVSGREKERCAYCYAVRLESAAREAKQGLFDGFSTTLLYSIYQKHALIREIGERIAGKYGLRFHYEDFRAGWGRGIERSKAMKLYRQQYCGCIYSEKERFMKAPRPASS